MAATYIGVNLGGSDSMYRLVEFPVSPFKGMRIVDPIPGVFSEWRVGDVEVDFGRGIVIVHLDLDETNCDHDEDKLWEAMVASCRDMDTFINATCKLNPNPHQETD